MFEQCVWTLVFNPHVESGLVWTCQLSATSHNQSCPSTTRLLASPANLSHLHFWTIQPSSQLECLVVSRLFFTPQVSQSVEWPHRQNVLTSKHSLLSICPPPPKVCPGCYFGGNFDPLGCNWMALFFTVWWPRIPSLCVPFLVFPHMSKPLSDASLKIGKIMPFLPLLAFWPALHIKLEGLYLDSWQTFLPSLCMVNWMLIP